MSKSAGIWDTSIESGDCSGLGSAGRVRGKCDDGVGGEMS